MFEKKHKASFELQSTEARFMPRSIETSSRKLNSCVLINIQRECVCESESVSESEMDLQCLDLWNQSRVDGVKD